MKDSFVLKNYSIVLKTLSLTVKILFCFLLHGILETSLFYKIYVPFSLFHKTPPKALTNDFLQIKIARSTFFCLATNLYNESFRLRFATPLAVVKSWFDVEVLVVIEEFDKYRKTCIRLGSPRRLRSPRRREVVSIEEFFYYY